MKRRQSNNLPTGWPSRLGLHCMRSAYFDSDCGREIRFGSPHPARFALKDK